MALRRTLLIALALFAYTSASASAAVTPNPWLTNRFLNIAHQGGEDEAPSNTLYALKSAVSEGGADMIEIDVHLTSDGQLVVLHDDTVNRTTEVTAARGSGDSQVRDLTLAEIQALDAGFSFRPGHYDKSEPASAYPFRGVRTGAKPPPAGYSAEDFRIPSLVEVFEAFPGTPINIEIKMPKSTDPANPYPATCGTDDGGPSQLCDDLDLTSPTTQALADLLTAPSPHAARDDLIVVSFAQEPMAEFASLAPDVNRAPSLPALTDYVIGGQPLVPDPVAFQVPPVFGSGSIQLPVPELLLGPQYDAHGNGYAVHVWTDGADDETTASYSRLVGLGVDGIMTTSPRKLDAFLCGAAVPHPDGSSRCEPTAPVTPAKVKAKCKKEKKKQGKASAAAKKKKQKKCKRKKRGKRA